MTVYRYERRRKDQRGTFAIYPVEGCWVQFGILDMSTELGRVKARTPSEALLVAARCGIGEGLKVWAIECLSADRVEVIE